MEKGELIAHVSQSSKKNPSPGPGSYNVVKDFGYESKAIKIRSRPQTHIVENNTPIFSPPSTFGKVPKITLGYRTEPKNTFQTPSPNYVPPQFGTQSRKISFPSAFKVIKDRDGNQTIDYKKKNQNETPGPGPCAYNIIDKTFLPNQKKGILMKGTHNFGYDVIETPGPGSYNPKFNQVLPSSPKINIHTKTEKKNENVITPDYRNLGSTLTGPKFTMKARAKDDI